VGNPFGLASTVTAGIVSADGRDLGGSGYGDFLQIDAAVNTGNSGGPAFNLTGEVIGVNTAIFSPNGGSVGIAFAIPASTVEAIVNSLISDGTVTRGFLGVTIQDINADIADSVGLERSLGALVTEPRAGGPAADAGVMSGDIITAVDGQPIDDATDLSRTIALKAPETPVELTIWRNRAETKVTVTLDKLDETEVATAPDVAPQPEQPPAPTSSSVGLTLVPNSGGTGVLIQGVDPESAAATRGFDVGDVIVQVDNKDVASADDFEAAVAAVREAGRATVLIKTERNGMTRFVGLPVGTGS
jgi:serine protease Do